MWRRGWDSNPRAGYPTRRFRGAPVTTTSVPLRIQFGGAEAQLYGATVDRLSRKNSWDRRAALGLQHAACDKHTMVERRVVERSHDRPNRPGARLRCPVHERGDASMYECSGTHQARLHGRVERRTAQPVVAQRASGVAKCHDLRMRGRIRSTNRLVEPGANQAPGVDDDRSDRHLSRFLGLDCPTKRLTHPPVMRLSVHRVTRRHLVYPTRSPDGYRDAEPTIWASAAG